MLYKTRSRYSFLKPAAFFLLGILSASQGYAQIPSGSYPTHDRITEQSLQQLRDLIRRGGDREQIEQHLNRVIHSSGYIPPLAEIYYKLAHNETDGETIVRYYKVLIEYYYKSAWAQKALVELVPLILMSERTLGVECERLIWLRLDTLLQPAADAAVSLGESPEILRADVLLHLIYLSHSIGDTGRVAALAKKEGFSLTPDAKAAIDLAAVYCLLRTGEKKDARDELHGWLNQYPNSDLRPLALLGLIHASETDTSKRTFLETMLKEYPDTLEALIARETVSQPGN